MPRDEWFRAFAWLREAGRPARSGLATSDAAGSFRIADLDPDTYAIELRAANFAPWRAPSVAIEVGRITTLAPHLAVAGHSETVLVRSETTGSGDQLGGDHDQPQQHHA